MTVGVDVGGTFTDLVAWDGGSLRVGKTSSTADQSVAVAEGTRKVLDGRRVPLLVHGTTVATNALLERSGVETVLVVGEGHDDLIEIGRQARPSLYDSFRDRADPLVPRSRRIGWDGMRDLAEEIRDRSPEAVAVALPYSFRDPEPERRAAGMLLSLDVPVVLSHLVVPEFREFERASTTVVNAYLQPTVASYLEHLQSRLVPDPADRIMVMRSSGGVIPVTEAADLPASILLSGPAGGVVASAALGDDLGYRHLISFDMGGTSTDVCRIDDGRPEVSYERDIDGIVVRMPAVAVHTVGAGGGSLGWLDPGGALRVGPRSAGALPGPACYGRGGTEPAVTDAHVVLGRIGGLLAGEVEVSRDAAEAALGRLGERMGSGPVMVAAGMIEVIEATMERAIRAVSVEEGADPRRAMLVAFGGAGGLHATALARRLDMAGVLVPPHAGVFSALGLLLAPPRRDEALSILLGEPDDEALDRAVSRVADAAFRALEGSIGGSPEAIETLLDVRYLGQSHETSVPYEIGLGWEGLAGRFHRIHRERNGFARPGDPIQVVTARAAAVGRPALRWSDLPAHRPAREPARRAPRSISSPGGSGPVPVWWRPAMSPGMEIDGPAIVTDPDSTTWLGSGERALLHDNGALEVRW